MAITYIVLMLRTSVLKILEKEKIMLGWALMFFILAIVAGVFGFGGIAEASSDIAQILFVVFLVLLVISLLARALRGKPPL